MNVRQIVDMAHQNELDAFRAMRDANPMTVEQLMAWDLARKAIASELADRNKRLADKKPD